MFSTLYIGFNSRRILHEWKMERKTTSFPTAENRRGAVAALSAARSRAKWALLWKTKLIHRLKMWKMRKTQALRGFSGGKLRGKPWNTFWKNVFQHRGNCFAKNSKSSYELGFSVFSPIFSSMNSKLALDFSGKRTNYRVFPFSPPCFPVSQAVFQGFPHWFPIISTVFHIPWIKSGKLGKHEVDGYGNFHHEWKESWKTWLSTSRMVELIREKVFTIFQASEN